MVNNQDILEKIRSFGLSTEEAKIYLELLQKPNTHLQLSRITGINRTKIYRLINDLEKKSLITRRTDDRGSFLVASDPKALEINLIAKEEQLKEQKSLFTQLLPTLSAIKSSDTSLFSVHTYEGEEGIKQQLWNEISRKSEMAIFGGGVLEELISDKKWVEKYREMNSTSTYRIRELLNFAPEFITKHQEYFGVYSCRKILANLLELDNPICIYDKTVSIYHRNNNQQVGVEIVNEPFASLMRQMFEYYWAMATPVTFK